MIMPRHLRAVPALTVVGILAGWTLPAVSECADYTEHLQLRGILDTPGGPLDILVCEADTSLIYAADDAAGLLVVSVADPSAPRIVATVPLPGARRLAARGSLLALASVDTGVVIFDASKPESPRLRTAIALPGGCRALTVSERHVFAAGADSTLRIIEAGAKCHVVATVRLPGPASGADVRGSLLAVACDSAGVQLVDVTDPSRPELLGLCYDSLHGEEGYRARFLDVVIGDRLLLAAAKYWALDGPYYYYQRDGVATFRIDDAMNPVVADIRLLGQYYDLNLRSRHGVVTLGGYEVRYWAELGDLESLQQMPHALLPGAFGPLVDVGALSVVSDPSHKRLIVYAGVEPGGAWDPRQWPSDHRAILADGDLVGLLYSGYGYDYDYDVPVVEKWMGAADYCTVFWGRDNVQEPPWNGAQDVTCLSPPYLGLHRDEVNYPYPREEHTLLMRLPANCTRWVGPYGEMPSRVRCVFDDVAVVHDTDSTGTHGLRFLDVSDLQNPVTIGTFEHPGITGDERFQLEGHRLYVRNTRTVLIVDVSDPSTPRLLGATPDDQLLDSYVDDSRIYQVVWPGDLVVIDAADPSSMSVLQRYHPRLPMKGILARQGVVYAMAEGLGYRWVLVAIDFSSPQAPVELGIRFGVAPAWGQGLCANDHEIYAGKYIHPFHCMAATPTVLQSFDLQPEGSALRLRWSLGGGAGLGEQRLTARDAAGERDLAVTAAGGGTFEALDTGGAPGQRVGYTLLLRDGDGWQAVAERSYEWPGAPPAQRAALLAPRPNPFNPRTEIVFDLPRAMRVGITVHDLAGRRVARLVDAPYPAGRHAIGWEARDDAGRPLPAGGYLLRMTTKQGVASRKLTLLK